MSSNQIEDTMVTWQQPKHHHQIMLVVNKSQAFSILIQTRWIKCKWTNNSLQWQPLSNSKASLMLQVGYVNSLALVDLTHRWLMFHLRLHRLRLMISKLWLQPRKSTYLGICRGKKRANSLISNSRKWLKWALILMIIERLPEIKIALTKINKDDLVNKLMANS